MPATVYAIVLEVTAMLSLWVGLSVWQRARTAPGSLLFTSLTGATLLWCFGELLGVREIVSEAQRDRIVFLGILAAPPLWVGVAAHSAGTQLAHRVPWFPLALMLPGAVLYGLLYGGPWSTLFVAADGAVSQGPLFDIWTGYARGLVLLGALLFLRAALRGNRSVTSLTLLAGVLITVVGQGLQTLDLLALPGDATPMILGLSLVPLRVAVFRGGLFDVVPVEQRDVLLQLPVGILLADEVRGVIEINPAAEARLALFRGQVLGRSLDAVLAEAVGGSRVRVEPLHLSPDTEILCAVVLDDLPELRPIRSAPEAPASATLSFGVEGSEPSLP